MNESCSSVLVTYLQNQSKRDSYPGIGREVGKQMHYFMFHDIGQESTQLEFILNDIKVMDSFQINKELHLKLISGISMLNLPLMMLV